MTAAAAVGVPVAVYTDASPEEDLGPGVDLLCAAGVEVRPPRSEAGWSAGSHADADYLLVGYQRIGEPELERLPRLRGIVTRSVGTDGIDLAAAAARGVRVANLPAVATEEVATHTLALALAALRGVVVFDRAVRAGAWDPTAQVLRRPSELTWGIVGMGRIGRAVARRAQVLVGEVVGHDPATTTPDWPSGVARADTLDELLVRADVLSLHVPLVAATRGLIGARELALLPADAVVVNVARGAVLDETALLDALDECHLAGAALDVLAEEPPVAPHPLVDHPRCVVTPHVAYLSAESAGQAVLDQARQVVAWAQRDATLGSMSPAARRPAPNRGTS
ncbi:NAD(P)-dependent oxidoreductase [Egicoccus halophilus]|uniref:Dehydrogenase n=1 Tax=Egicoccus halophilus TaxID=1670830 RepID=A0A8J3AF62_9ACTN|nr:NAD(P)-dependent oxidoreductase [Egicoccus halophilus]GGI07013.1 dehydrogenase [Egicoccus halophilus]